MAFFETTACVDDTEGGLFLKVSTIGKYFKRDQKLNNSSSHPYGILVLKPSQIVCDIIKVERFINEFSFCVCL